MAEKRTRGVLYVVKRFWTQNGRRQETVFGFYLGRLVLNPVVCQNSAEHISHSPIVVENASEPFATLDVSAHVRSSALIVD